MEKGEKMVTEITCVDPRVREYVEGQMLVYDGLTVLKNAGANAWGFEQSLQMLKDEDLLDEVVLAQHTECAAVGLLYKALKGEVELSESLKKWPPFARLQGRKFSSEQELHDVYTAEQLKWLKETFGVKVTVKLADMKKLGLSGVHYPKEERELLVARVSSITPSETIRAAGNARPEKTYFATALILEDIAPDIEIAVSHIGISRIALAANGDEENTEMQALKRRIDSAPYAGKSNGVETRVWPIPERARSRRLLG